MPAGMRCSCCDCQLAQVAQADRGRSGWRMPWSPGAFDPVGVMASLLGMVGQHRVRYSGLGWSETTIPRAACRPGDRGGVGLVGGGVHGDDFGAGEDFLVDDEEEADEVEGEDGGEDGVDFPALAGFALVGDPTADGGQAQQEQGGADGEGLVEPVGGGGGAGGWGPAQ